MITTLTLQQKLARLRELMEEDHPGITHEELMHKIVDEALEHAEELASNRAFHITFREPEPAARSRRISHLSLVTE